MCRSKIKNNHTINFFNQSIKVLIKNNKILHVYMCVSKRQICYLFIKIRSTQCNSTFLFFFSFLPCIVINTNRYFYSNSGDGFKFCWIVGRRCTSYEIVAHRSYSRIRWFSEYGLEISFAREGTRFGSVELFLFSKRLC